MNKERFIISLLVVALLAAAAPRSTPAEEPSTITLQKLEEQIKVLQAQVNALKHQQDASQQEAAKTAMAAAEKAKETPIVTIDKDGFALKSADGNNRLRVGGYIQADSRTFLQDKAGNEIDTFLLRRVRPILEGTICRDFDFRVMTDLGNGASSSTLIQDAYLEWHYWPWLKVRGGKFKPPVGLEQLQSDTDLFFTERGLPSDLVPQRDVGLQLSGDLFGGVVSYAGGVFNGVADGAIADLDAGDAKDFVARVFFQPFKKTDIRPLQGLGFGIAGTIGDQQTLPTSTNSLPTYKTTGQQAVFSYLKNTVPNGTEFRASPQAYYYWGPFGLIGEYVVTDEAVRNGVKADRLRNDAWQVAASFVLTGEKASYKGVTPRKPFDPRTGGWGAFELVGRYGELHIDSNAFPTFADPTKSIQEAREWGVGLNWYLNKNVKAVLDYEQTGFDGGAVGKPVANRPAERVIFTRLQLAF
jgi:phosphate-selective porin OprO/OprP